MTGPANGSGALETRIQVRVRYPETDRMGVAYHAHYLVWFEVGRTEMLREMGTAYAELEESEGVFFPVIEAGARYHAPARYDDMLQVTTRLANVGASRVRFEYEVRRDAALLASGFTEHATVGSEGRARRLPEALRARLLSREAKGC